MRYVHSASSLASVPLGGVGTGSVEIGSDGRFREWQVFNNRPWAGYGQPENLMDPDDLVIFLRIPGSREPVVRGLFTGLWYATVEDYTYRGCGLNVPIEPYHVPWAKGVESVELDARFPVVRLEYRDGAFERAGLRVSLDVASPLVPGELDLSAAPVIPMRLRLRNEGARPVDVSVMVYLRAPYRRAGLRSDVKVVRSGGYTAVEALPAGADERSGLAGGGLAVGIVGQAGGAALEVDSANRAEFVRSLRNLLVDFRGDGEVRGSDEVITDKDGVGVLTKSVTVQPGSEASVDLFVAWYFPNHVDAAGRRVGHYYENLFKGLEQVVDFAAKSHAELVRRAEEVSQAIYDVSYDQVVPEAVSAQLTSIPKLSWLTKDGHFGLWEGGPGCCGINTVDVALWGFTAIAMLYPSLVKVAVQDFLRHVLVPDKHYYYELWALSFPENMAAYREMLRKDPSIQHSPEKFSAAIREIVAKTRKDPAGRVPHSFRASFDLIDTYDRNDLMPELLLLAALAYRSTGDRDFVRSAWGQLMLIVRGTMRQHDDLGLGLIYHTPPSDYEGFSYVADEAIRRGLVPGFYSGNVLRVLFSGPAFVMNSLNTFDTLSLMGVASFTADLWAAALKALADVAGEVGEPEEGELRAMHAKAASNMVKLLWNGRYFDSWYDPVSGLRDRSSLAAQLVGEWLLEVMGSGPAIDRELIRKALRYIYENNFRYEEGVINAVYPDGPRPSMVGDVAMPNGTGLLNRVSSQADTPWTGVEYGLASQLIYEGMVEEGLEIVRSVHDRYRSWGLYWNHLECDGHYMRPLAAVTLVNAMAGASYDAARRSLRLGPRAGRESFRGPLALGGALLRLSFSEGGGSVSVELAGVSGSLQLSSVEVETGRAVSSVRAELDGAPVAARLSKGEGVARVEFEAPVRLAPGSRLRLTLA